MPHPTQMSAQAGQSGVTGSAAVVDSLGSAGAVDSVAVESDVDGSAAEEPESSPQALNSARGISKATRVPRAVMA